MLKVITITAIISAIGALLNEILCTEVKAKSFWLGTFTLYFCVSSLAFYLLWDRVLQDDIPKQVLVFLLVAMLSFAFSVLVAWVVIHVFQKWEEEETKKLETQEEGKAGQGEKEE